MDKLVNFLLFQAGWFGIVFSAAAGHPGWATAIAGIVLGLHLGLAASPVVEMKLALSAGLTGLTLDSALTANGLLNFASGQWTSWLAPHWIVAMWMMFATVLNSSLNWLKGRYGLAAVFGGIGGPAAYYGGAQLGAVVLTQPMQASLLGVALVWALATPLLVRFATIWNGVTPEEGGSS